MSRWLYLLILFPLGLVAPAAAEDWYELGTVLLSKPVLVSDQNVRVTFDIPDYGPGIMVQQATPRACQKWGRLGHPEWANLDEVNDEDDFSITPHKTTDYLRGHFVFTLRLRNSDPRWVCIRLPFVRLYEEAQ